MKGAESNRTGVGVGGSASSRVYEIQLVIYGVVLVVCVRDIFNFIVGTPHI